MASKYDWDFVRPLDQTASIAAMGQGNQQINAGLAAMQQSIGGLADTFKQRNTDEILNRLYQAQNSAQLPEALQAIQAMQQQYGRGYDQAAVRNAVDSRGSTLGARDLQAINLQQAQAAQAAIPQLNQAYASEAIRRGLNPEQANSLAGLGIDVSSNLNTLAGNNLTDTRYAAETAERKANRKEDVEYRNSQANRAQSNWQADYDFRTDESNWNRGGDLAKENPKSSGYGTDANGDLVTVNNAGTSRLEAYGALSSVRGIRNNNPGNLSFAGQRGASRENGQGRFAAFSTPEEGIAAMGKQLDMHFNGTSLKAKEAGRPLQSVQDIIHAWAPPNENNTKKYIADVSKQLGVSPTSRLNLKDEKTKTALMQAIVAKENGGNPYTPQQYASALGGKTSPAQQAQQALSGNPVSQKVMSDVTQGYQQGVAKLNATYGADRSKEQLKGSAAATGKSVDTWVAGKQETSWFGNSSNPIVTKAGDIGKMARESQAFQNLPADAQVKILDTAYGYLRNSGTFERVPNKQIRDLINKEANAYQTDRVSQFNQAKDAEFEKAYQGMVGAFQAAGSTPPNRDAARKILDPQSAPKAAAPAPKPAQPKPAIPQTIAKPNNPVAQSKSTGVPAMDKQLADRAERKQRERDALDKKLAAQKASATKNDKPSATFASNAQKFTMPAGKTNLSQEDLNKLFKEYKVR